MRRPGAASRRASRQRSAAALTPLRADGREIDDDAVRPYVDFLAARGIDGVLVAGTTGEGILLDPPWSDAA